MKTRTKALLLTLCAVLLVTASVMGTMAYLTSNDSVTNTFTVGQVKITLDEAKVNDEGKPIDKEKNEVTDLAAAERVKSNTYKLMPGHKYTKDPTVTVKAGSEESYVRLLVTVNFEKTLTDEQLKLDLSTIFTGTSTKWVRNAKKVENNVTVGTGEDAKTYGTVITYEYRYVDGDKTTVAATTADTKLDPLFKGITVPGDWDNDTLKDIGDFNINVVAQAIQADGFVADTDENLTAADAAWAAFGD